MTRARRRSKRPGVDLERLVTLFSWGDGTDSPFDAVAPLDPFTAKASWPSARSATWLDWAEWGGVKDPTRPPGAAAAYDGLGRRYAELRLPEWRADEETARKVLRTVATAARAELKALARFRLADAAAGIASPLDLYERGLQVRLEIATTCESAPAAYTADQEAAVTRLGSGG